MRADISRVEHFACSSISQIGRDLMIDYRFFETLLSERLGKICGYIESKNSNVQHIQDSQLMDEGDVVSAAMQGNNDIGMIKMYQKEMADIKLSLQKIQDGIFGICEMCDDEIDVERLKVKPHAKYCINCRELYEKAQKKERV